MTAVAPLLLLAGGLALLAAAAQRVREAVADLGTHLGEWFTVGELLVTGTGLPNVPTAEHLDNLGHLVRSLLDPLRDALEAPLVVTSGYRSADVNEAVGGHPHSHHLDGNAADVRPPAGWTAEELAELVHRLDAAGLVEVGECIWYDQARGGHVHLASTRSGERGQYLHAPAPEGYVAWAP